MQDDRPQRNGLGPRGAPLAAGIALVALAAAYAAMAEPSRRDRAALAYAALWVPALYLIRAAWSSDDRRTVGAVLALAVLARLPMLAAAPLWSNDAYRYVWDGRLSARGIDPRAVAPNDPSLEAERLSPLWPRIDLRTIPTVYPPFALALFRLAAIVDRDGVRGAKLVAIGGDFATLALLLFALRRAKLPRGRAAFYALHPLVLVSFAQDAHIESVAVAGIAAALCGGRAWRVAGLAVATLSKLYPIVLAPLAFVRDRRGALALAAVVGLAYLPAVLGGSAAGSLRSYLGDQRFNETLFLLIGPVGAFAVLVGAVLAATVAAWRGAGLAAMALAVITAYLLATPNALPWYLTVLPVLIALVDGPFAGRAGPVVAGIALWTGTVALAYAAPWYVRGGTAADFALRAVQYAPLVTGLVLWGLGGRR